MSAERVARGIPSVGVVHFFVGGLLLSTHSVLLGALCGVQCLARVCSLVFTMKLSFGIGKIGGDRCSNKELWAEVEKAGGFRDAPGR